MNNDYKPLVTHGKQGHVIKLMLLVCRHLPDCKCCTYTGVWKKHRDLSMNDLCPVLTHLADFSMLILITRVKEGFVEILLFP